MKDKTAGEKLFDSYDTRVDRDRGVSGRFPKIRDNYPYYKWRDLSQGDRLNWERIASTNSLRF
jgi:hypothetical protein